MPELTFDQLCSDCSTDVKEYRDNPDHGRLAMHTLAMNENILPEIPVGYAPNASRTQRREMAAAVAEAKERRLKAARRALVRELAPRCGFSTEECMLTLEKRETAGLIAAFLILIFCGPVELFIIFICAVAGWWIESELDEKYPPKAIAVCCAAYRQEASAMKLVAASPYVGRVFLGRTLGDRVRHAMVWMKA